jgi:hypothetical protein
MSENLRKKVHELLVRTMNELKEMFDAVNLSMNRRVMETSEAKKTLTDHLKRVWIKTHVFPGTVVHVLFTSVTGLESCNMQLSNHNFVSDTCEKREFSLTLPNTSGFLCFLPVVTLDK